MREMGRDVERDVGRDDGTSGASRRLRCGVGGGRSRWWDEGGVRGLGGTGLGRVDGARRVVAVAESNED